MAKVDWITWKTDPKELINKDKIETELNKNISNLNGIVDNISSNLKIEIDKGGLNKEALTISGESPNNEMANRMIKKIEKIKETTTRLNNKIMSQVEEQKIIEKGQLVEAIEKKLAEQEKILENTKALKDRLSTSNNLISSNDVNNVISATEEKITMLRERLEKAKAI